MSNNSATNFEQCTVIKGGACTIIGNDQSSVNWSKCAMDYLLLKSLQNSKYKRVFIVCLDQNVEDIKSFLKLGCIDSTILETRASIFIEWELFVNEWKSVTRSFQDCDGSYFGIFLYSLSELILINGIEYISSSIRPIVAQCNYSSRSTDTAQKSSVQHPTLLFVTNLDYTLHPVSTINYVSSIFPTTVSVKPNDGTLSQSIAAEVQTVRRSLVSSKMFEHIDYFTWKSNMITPVLKVDDNVGHNNQKLSTEEGGENQDELKNTLQSTLIDGSVSKINPRLITFDSTDPEFDDDDDPDQDLDL